MPPKPKAFYLRPLAAVPKDPTKPWFANVPVGVNTLKNIVSKIAEQAGSTNKYTNHSLRATATSRMFVKNVPEKIIAEKTGRSLAGLRAYECTTLDQERAVTKSLGSVNATFCLPDENYPTESKPKLDPCNKKKSSDFPMFTCQMENCVFNFY